MQKKHNDVTSIIITALWSNWAIGFGAIAISLILPRIMPHFWLPIPLYALAYFVSVYKHRQEAKGFVNYVATLETASLTLFWSATVMLVIALLSYNHIADDIFHWSSGNPKVPFIVGLIMFPVLTLMSVWMMFTGYGQNKAGSYRFKEGMSDGASVIASFFTRANRYQVNVLCMIGVGISVIDWWYYFKYYINVNMNTPDIFFFNWMPVIFYAASLYFMWVRYSSIAMIIGPIVGANADKGVLVRYLILSGDYMLLTTNQNGRWDTPAETHIEHLKAHNEREIREALVKLTDTEDFTLKYLYESGATSMSSMQLHYAAFLPERNLDKLDQEGQWFTLDQIDRMLHKAELSAEFTDELYRLFTITMAWKTYDQHGMRLYPIKNYRPTFRLRDMKDWTVDYDDPNWMVVAQNNQDRPFFRTRRLWQRLTGVRLK